MSKADDFIEQVYEQVGRLIDKAAKASTSEDAVRYSQAACNAATRQAR
jgi:hypothetical protein